MKRGQWPRSPLLASFQCPLPFISSIARLPPSQGSCLWLLRWSPKALRQAHLMPVPNPTKSQSQQIYPSEPPPDHTMTTETTARQPLYTRPSDLSAGPGSQIDHIPSRSPNTTRMSRVSLNRTHGTHKKSKDAPYETRIWLRLEDLKRQRKIRWKTKARRSQFDTYKQERGSFTLSTTYVGSDEPSPKTPSSCTVGSVDHEESISDDIKERVRIGESKHDAILSREAEEDTTLVQHRALNQSELEKKNTATETYRATGDVTVFAPFMAPFLGGPNKPKLGSWVWDRSVERWRREHKLNGEIVWGPTDDSFI